MFKKANGFTGKPMKLHADNKEQLPFINYEHYKSISKSVFITITVLYRVIVVFVSIRLWLLDNLQIAI